MVQLKSHKIKLVHQPNFEIIEKKRQKTPTFYGCQASVLDLS